MSEYLARSPKPEKGIPVQTYKQHVSEVMRMTTDFAEKAAYSAYGPLLREVVGYAAAYHDLGKLDDENQKVLRTAGKGSLPVKHWDAGAAHLMSNPKILANKLAALFVHSHHEGLPSLIDRKSVV